MGRPRKPEETAGPAAMLARRGYYTVSQAAERIDKSPDTIRRWIRKGLVSPETVECGSQRVSVFTAEDLKALRQVGKSTKTGRPKVGLVPMKRSK